MKKISTILIYFASTILLILACTKDVGLFTEVEFQVLEQHTTDGYVNELLATTVTVIPEEQLPDYEYFYSYSVINGQGHFQDMNGAVLPEGERIPLNPLSASMQYIGTSIGVHTVKIRAEDTFGFTEEIELSYTINEVPVVWTATSPVSQIAPGAIATITVQLESGANNSNTTYERNYRITSGSGSLAESGGAEVVLQEFIQITPGVYQYNFIPNALGTAAIEFRLKDNYGQEYLAEVKFEVADIISVSGINVTPSSAAIIQGSTQQLNVEFTPLDATNQGLTWTSDNPAVAIVNTNGLVTAISEGTAIITATSTDNTSLSDTSGITVSAIDIPATGISITPPSATVLLGNTQQLTATFTPLDATNQEVEWTSNNPTVATVDSNGLVTTVSEGTATITGTSLDNTSLSGSSQITVSAVDIPVTNISITPSSATVLMGNTQQLSAMFTPSDATNQEVEWTSNNTAVATVDTNGLVTAVSEGTATITGTSVDNTSLSDSTEITVSAITIPVTGIAVTPPSALIGQGNTQQLIATFTPSDATNQGVEWTSSDPTVATVDANGLVTAISGGTAFIKGAALDNNTIADTSEITVTPIDIPVTGITVTSNRSSIPDDETEQFMAIAAPSNATNQQVTWSSSNTAIATVDPTTGLVSAVSAGTVNIIATATDGSNVMGSAGLIVTNSTILVSGITVTRDRSSIPDDEMEQFTAIIAPTDATNQVVNWSSSNPAIATVNPTTGLVSAVSQGTVNIIASATDGSNVTGSASLIVTSTNRDPIAVASGPSTTFRNTDVTFTGDSSSDPDLDELTYSWDFGDGSPVSNLENPIHQFTALGDYNVVLTVNDGNGGTNTTSISISVENIPPTAVGAASTLSGSAPLTVSFRNLNSTDEDGTVENTSYVFGDGTSNNGGWPYAVSHTYTDEGNYTARMTVTDNNGGTDFVEFNIVVGPPQTPSYTFSITPNSGDVDGPVSLRFDINPNQAAIDQGISFQMSFNGTGLTSLGASLDYNTNIYRINDVFSVSSGTSFGFLEGFSVNCSIMRLDFTVTSNLPIPSQSQNINFYYENTSRPCD